MKEDGCYTTLAWTIHGSTTESKQPKKPFSNPFSTTWLGQTYLPLQALASSDPKSIARLDRWYHTVHVHLRTQAGVALS